MMNCRNYFIYDNIQVINTKDITVHSSCIMGSSNPKKMTTVEAMKKVAAEPKKTSAAEPIKPKKLI